MSPIDSNQLESMHTLHNNDPSPDIRDKEFFKNEHIICASPPPEDNYTEEQLHRAIQEVNEDIANMETNLAGIDISAVDLNRSGMIS